MQEKTLVDAYNKEALTFAASRKNMKWEELDILMQQTATQKPVNIADIGCGNGRLIEYLKNAFPNMTYSGYDASSGMIQEAKKQYPDHEFMQESMQDFSKKNDFERIFMIASYHHILTTAQQKDVAKRVYHALKPEGIWAMTNWNLESPQNKEKYPKRDKQIVQVKLGDALRYYYSFCDNEIEQIAHEAGFTLLYKNTQGKNFIHVYKK